MYKYILKILYFDFNIKNKSCLQMKIVFQTLKPGQVTKQNTIGKTSFSRKMTLKLKFTLIWMGCILYVLL